ncbi:MAG: hypothetical protein GY754_14110 [bacterium]|nr:hypothetical protein [bacterium]
MKKNIILLILFVIITTIPAYTKNSFLDSIRVSVTGFSIKKKAKNNYSVNFTVTHKGLVKGYFDDAKILMTMEDMVITGPMPGKKISERNFLFAELNYDLNNDSDLKDSYFLRKKSGKYYLNRTPLKILMAPKKINKFSLLGYYDYNKKLLINRISSKGHPFTVYGVDYPNKKITVGLSRNNKKIPVKEFPNPSVQILVIKQVEALFEKPGYSISSEENFITFSNEKIFSDQMDNWTSTVWAVKALLPENRDKSNLTFSINNISPPFAVIVFVNLSLETGTRIRTSPFLRIVK